MKNRLRKAYLWARQGSRHKFPKHYRWTTSDFVICPKITFIGINGLPAHLGNRKLISLLAGILHANTQITHLFAIFTALNERTPLCHT